MGIFNEWIEKRSITEGVPAGWKPSASIGSDPLRSALEKIVRGLKAGHLDQGYTDSGVIKITFGLNDDELQRLKNIKLIGPSQDYGWDINKDRLSSVYKQISGGLSANMTPKSSPPMLPPPPARKYPLPALPTGRKNPSPPADDTWKGNPFGN